MNPADRAAWTAKTERLNENLILQRGMKVRDVQGDVGIVVDIVHGDSVEDHGTVTVWQSERYEYGSDNCEHYPFFIWKSILRVLEMPNGTSPE